MLCIKKMLDKRFMHTTLFTFDQSESPQTLQTSNGWASVFLPLKYVNLVSYGVDWRKEHTSGVFVLCCIICFPHNQMRTLWSVKLCVR